MLVISVNFYGYGSSNKFSPCWLKLMVMNIYLNVQNEGEVLKIS